MVLRQTWNPKLNCYDAYTRVCSRQPNLTGEWTGSFQAFRRAVLGGDLGSPVSSLAEPTVCTMYFLRLKADGTSEIVPESFVGYNDDPSLSGIRGTYCRVQMLDGLWRIYYMGCDEQTALITALDELEA